MHLRSISFMHSRLKILVLKTAETCLPVIHYVLFTALRNIILPRFRMSLLVLDVLSVFVH